ncbi:NTP/NDP exchange transporter [Rudaea sp.]|uniref:NTP/NDP exchange transporter n=1 Tax=Rudaea sp. TaxID=2136325 RepID=UPI002ED6A170
MATSSTEQQRGLFRVESAEWPALILSCAYFFCVLAAYYVLRPVQGQLAAASGSQVLFQFYLTTFIVTLILTPVYGWLIARFPRKHFVPIVYAFFIVNLLAFIPVFEAQGELNPRVLGQVFFVWMSVFNLFVVAVFWSFVADIFSADQAYRLFGVVALGGTLGAIAGPLLTKYLVHVIGIGPLLGVSAALLAGAIACVLGLVAWSRRHPVARDVRRNEEVIGGGFWAGAKLVFGSKFLRRIALLVLLGDSVGGVLYNLQTDIGHQYLDGAARTEFFANVDFATNALMALIQIFVTRLALTRFGPARSVSATELVKFLTLVTLALVGQPAAVAAALIVTRAGSYGINNPAIDSLYTRVDRETRYKAKGFVDTAVWRFGDVAVVGVLSLLRDFGYAAPSFFAALGALASISAAWIAWRLRDARELAPEQR